MKQERRNKDKDAEEGRDTVPATLTTSFSSLSPSWIPPYFSMKLEIEMPTWNLWG